MKKTKLSEGALKVLEVLRENGGEMTFREIKDVFPGANPSHLGALGRAEVVESETKEVYEVIRRKAEKTVYRAFTENESESESE